MNEHIGRLQAIGLGKEVTSGTPVAASFWFPKTGGNFRPRQVTAQDRAAYGNIAGLSDQQTVKNTTMIDLSASITDIPFGYLLLAAFGLEYATISIPLTSISGTFVEGETVTQSGSGATGVIRRLDQNGVTGTAYVSVSSGTFAGSGTLTGGTSGATGTGGSILAIANAADHVFRMKNDNNHPSFTMYGKDPVGAERAAYCMLDTLDIEIAAGGYATFTASFMGKKLTATTATPVFAEYVPFLAKFASFKSADTFAGLDAATPVEVTRIRISIRKNLTDYQGIGSVDTTSIHNQVFEMSGDFDLLYKDATWRDAVSDSDKKAMRLTFENTDQLIPSTAASPKLQIDIPQASFREWTRTEDNDTLVTQTLAFDCEYDSLRNMIAEAVLRNAKVTAY